MSKLRLIVLTSMAIATGAFAQGNSAGIIMSTDPAKIAAIEKHAEELKARPTQETQVKPAAKHSASPKAKPGTKAKHTSAKPVAKKKS